MESGWCVYSLSSGQDVQCSSRASVWVTHSAYTALLSSSIVHSSIQLHYTLHCAASLSASLLPDYCPFPNIACIFSYLYFPLLIWFASFLPSPSLSPSPSLCFPCSLCLPCSVQMLKLQRLRNSCRGNGTSSCILCGHDFAHHRSRSPTSLHFCHECAKVCV